MSFVSVFITKEFASVMSDGQVTGDNKESIQDDYKKIIKVNNFLIGFTGNGTAPIELIKTAIKETSEIMGQAVLNKDFLLMLIRECLNKYEEHTDVKTNVVLVGFNEGIPVASTITLEHSEIHEEKVELRGNIYRLITLCPFDYRLEDGSEGVEFMEKVNALGENKLTLDRVIEIQREVNDFVADNSDTVNKVVFSEFVINDHKNG